VSTTALEHRDGITLNRSDAHDPTQTSPGNENCGKQAAHAVSQESPPRLLLSAVPGAKH